MSTLVSLVLAAVLHIMDAEFTKELKEVSKKEPFNCENHAFTQRGYFITNKQVQNNDRTHEN